MRRDFLFGIGLLALVGAGAGPAIAADIPVRPMPPVAAPATCCAVPDWVGFYVGIHGGGGWGHTSFDPAIFESIRGVVVEGVFTEPSASPKGGVFGFQFGHNWQWGPVVGGLEIDFSGADLKETTTFFSPVVPNTFFTRDRKIDELASARGRLGYLIFPNWLLYGPAGIGWGHFRLHTTDAFVRDGLFALTDSTSFANEFGWVVGAGLEFKFWNNWMVRGEWLHYDFGRVTHNDTAFP